LDNGAAFSLKGNMPIIEVDGGTHSTGAEIARDAARASYLKARGYHIFRTHNDEVFENIDGVLDTLLAFIEGKVS
jgi:very-short-patch-repair endonuclease